MDKLIYLDNNATTKVDERVLEEMMPYFKEEYANPSSMYDFSKKSSHAIREARGKLKDFLGAENEKEIIFTSCGSESANTAIRGYLANTKKKHIITTKIEHPCVLNVYKYLEKQGYKVDYIGVNSNGELNTDELSHLINDDTALVSVMWANNETGVLNPIKEISEIIKSKNPETKFFVDGVQAAGKVPINVADCGVDMLGISGHKLHAPKGIGALYVNSKTMISPLMIGGHQEKGNSEKEPVGPGASETKAKVSSGTASRFNGYPEYKVNMEVALKLRTELLKRGYTVIMTRTGHAVNIRNIERATIANNVNADAFIRIHCNGSENASVHGIGIYYQTPQNPYNAALHDEAKALNGCMLRHMLALTGARDDGLVESDAYSGINWCKVPAGLVEMGYMTNQEEDAKLQDGAYQNLLAQGMADGIDEFLSTRTPREHN